MTAYLGLGSNIGDRFEFLSRAKSLLAGHQHINNVVSSPVYETDPAGYADQAPFLNAVLSMDATLDPHDLLAVCAAIEIQLGRERTISNGPRTIDIDIELLGDTVIFSESLIVPHPRLQERDFVLRPLIDLDPVLVHPLLSVPLTTLLTNLEHRYIKSTYSESI